MTGPEQEIEAGMSDLSRLRGDLMRAELRIGLIDAALRVAEDKRERDRDEFWRFIRAVLTANLLVSGVVLLVVVLA